MMCLLGWGANAAQIFYESFEAPVVTGRTTTIPTGWVKNTELGTGGVGLSDGVSGATGTQCAWIGRYGGRLETTSAVLSSNLEANVNYTLTWDGSVSRDTGFSIVELLAGTNVIAATTNLISTVGDLSVESFSITFLALPDHPHLGETLGIRLSTYYNITHNLYIYWDNMSLEATDTSSDLTPPSPTNMVFVGLPTSSVSNSITMQAATASDTNGVQYYFENTTRGNNSGWQDSPIWSDTGLTPKESYNYRVKARDKSVNANETGWSSTESAECEEHIVFYSSFEEISIQAYGARSFTSWPLPPIGWTYNIVNSLDVWHDDGGVVNTPFGYQYAAMREGNEVIAALSGHVLEPEYTYRVTYNVGGMDGGGGAAKPTTCQAELIAGASLIASNAVVTALNDFSETNGLSYVVDSAHTNLGEALSVKLWVVSTPLSWNDRGQIDNVKVYAIPPPPKGTVILLY